MKFLLVFLLACSMTFDLYPMYRNGGGSLTFQLDINSNDGSSMYTAPSHSQTTSASIAGPITRKVHEDAERRAYHTNLSNRQHQIEHQRYEIGQIRQRGERENNELFARMKKQQDDLSVQISNRISKNKQFIEKTSTVIDNAKSHLSRLEQLLATCEREDAIKIVTDSYKFGVGVLKGANESANESVHGFVKFVEGSIEASLSPVKTAEKVSQFFKDHNFSDIARAFKISAGNAYNEFVSAEPEMKGEMLGKFTWGLVEGVAISPYCFPAGTPVLADNGQFVAIEDLKAHDKILSCDLKGNLCEQKEIKRISNHIVDHLQVISILRKTDGKIEEIKATDEHPFYVKGKEWVPASDLQENDELISLDGEKVTVISKGQIDGEFTVYNIAVKGNHNYYVGENAVLVHNCKSIAEGLKALKVVESSKEAISKLGLTAKNELKEFKYIAREMIKEKELGAINPGALIEAWDKKAVSSVASNVTRGSELNLQYKAASYHGKVGNAVKSKAPTNAQAALDHSVQISENAPRRISVDPVTKEFVIFDRTGGKEFHGHVREWGELLPEHRTALHKYFNVSKKGKVK